MSDDNQIRTTVRQMKIVTLGLVMGVTAFLGVVIFLAINNGGKVSGAPVSAEMNSGVGAEPVESSTGPEGSIVPVLTYLAVPMSILFFFVGGVVRKITLSRGIREDVSLEKKLATVQSAHLVRMALSEGDAIFGVVIILIGVLSADVPPIAYANVIPILLFYSVAAMSFPSQERVQALLNPAADGQAGRYRK